MSDKTLKDLTVDAHIAVLHTKVDALIEKQKELTERVRANEKVVAALGVLGSIAIAFIGAGALAPRAEACSQPLDVDGSPANCGPPDVVCLGIETCPKEPIVTPMVHKPEEPKYITDWNRGKVVLVDTREDNAFVLMDTYHKMVDKLRELKREQNRTSVDDLINNSIAKWEKENGSNDPTESEELLQFQSNGNSQSVRWRYD